MYTFRVSNLLTSYNTNGKSVLERKKMIVKENFIKKFLSSTLFPLLVHFSAPIDQDKLSLGGEVAAHVKKKES